MSPLRWRTAVTFVAAFILLGANRHWLHQSLACPFCSSTQQTLTQEMDAADAVILARLSQPAEPPSGGDAAGPGDPQTGLSTFTVERVLKGAEHIDGAKQVKALHFGQSKPDEMFLINGQMLPDLQWSTPIPLSKDAVDYVVKLLELPAKGADRLAFFQDYLQHEDSLLSQDSYDEFAKAPYSDVKDLRPQMRHDELIGWIQDEQVSPSHRRLYLTMLSVCGTEDDLALLEDLMQSDERRKKAGLDAMIACYLTLKGPEGMPLIEDLFIKNTDAEYADTYAAVMALRFHGQESDVIPKERLVQGLRHMLDRPELADLVIADLARWQDWESMDKMVALFENADDKSSWVRVPVVNYLQAAAKQSQDHKAKAEAAIAKLEKIDAAAVKQARSYAAFGALAQPKQPADPVGDQFARDAQRGNEDEPGSEPTADAGQTQSPDSSGADTKDPAPGIDDAGPAATEPVASPTDEATGAEPAATATSPRSMHPEVRQQATQLPLAPPKDGAISAGPPPQTDEAAGEPSSDDSRTVLRTVVIVAFGGLVLVGLRLFSQATARSDG